MTWFLNQVMDHEAELQSGAERYVRGNGRRAHRNGHRERTLKTMAKKHWPEVFGSAISSLCPVTVSENLLKMTGNLGMLAVSKGHTVW